MSPTICLEAMLCRQDTFDAIHGSTSYRPRPVLLDSFFGVQELAIVVLKGSSPIQDLKERDTQRPDVRLASVMGQTAGTFWREVLREIVRHAVGIGARLLPLGFRKQD